MKENQGGVSHFIRYRRKSAGATYLFHFTEVEGISVVGTELHKPHVRALRELRNAFDTWKEPRRRKINAQLIALSEFDFGGNGLNL